MQHRSSYVAEVNSTCRSPFRALRGQERPGTPRQCWGLDLVGASFIYPTSVMNRSTTLDKPVVVKPGRLPKLRAGVSSTNAGCIFSLHSHPNHFDESQSWQTVNSDLKRWPCMRAKSPMPPPARVHYRFIKRHRLYSIVLIMPPRYSICRRYRRSAD